MTAFIISVVFGLITIPILKKLKVKQSISVFLNKLHNEKKGVPTMGGIIFIIPTIASIIILMLMGKLEFSNNLFIILFVFIGYAFLGFFGNFLSDAPLKALLIMWRFMTYYVPTIVGALIFNIFNNQENNENPLK